jgi:PAS domain S-box-containing protein
MPDFFQSTFMPHGYCLQWNGSLLATFVIGNALIAMAYFSIPTSLWWFQKKRTDLAFRWIFLLFATFISACGITHLVKIWTIWHADYWLEASLDAFTGIVSVITAFALWRILPLALQLPTPSQIAEDQNKIAQLEMQANQNAVILEQLSLAIACIKDYSIVLLDPNGAVMTWNDGAAGLQGYSSAEIIGKNVSAFYTPEDLEKGSPEHDLIRAIAAGQVQDTKHLVKKDGSTFLANVVITPVYKDGTLKGFSIVTRDITDIKRIEDEVRGLKEFYETVLSNLNDGVIVAESTGKFIYHNEMAARTNPKILQPVPIETWSETLGLHLPDMTTPFPHDELPLAKAFRGEKTTATEIYLKNETLESGRWLEVSGTPIRVPTASDLNCGVLVIRDITSRKDSEQKLKNV